MNIMRQSWAAVLLAAAVACQTTESPEQMNARIKKESDAAKTAIAASNAKFTSAVAAGQADQIGAMYAEESHLMPPNAPLVHDREDIQKFWAGFLAMGSITMTLETEDVVANGPVSVEIGSFSMSLKPPADAKGAAPMEEKGKYMVQRQLVGGKWEIVNDIWNTDTPAPAPEPAKKK
jgi:ketosteroid isomerase-like protein